MINHAHFRDTLKPFSRFERVCKRNQHPRVTGDLERVLGDNYYFYSNVSSRSSISYMPPKHLSNHHGQKPQKLEMALEITLPFLTLK